MLVMPGRVQLAKIWRVEAQTTFSKSYGVLYAIWSQSEQINILYTSGIESDLEDYMHYNEGENGFWNLNHFQTK